MNQNDQRKIVHVKCTGYSIYFDTKNKKINESYVWIDSIEYPRDYWKVPFDNFNERCFHTKAEAEDALERSKHEE